MEMEKQVIHEKDDDIHLNLRLGLPGSESPEADNKISGSKRASSDESSAPPTKTQVVGWPPVRSYRKNVLEQKKSENYVKVSMDGVPFLRKIDLKVYKNYTQLLEGLQKMFKCSTIGYNINTNGISEVNAPTYQDKDGDWMLAGDVPWHMFITSCQRMRIMKASEAKGLGCL